MEIFQGIFLILSILNIATDVPFVFAAEVGGGSVSVSSSVTKGPTYKAEMLLEAKGKDCTESATVVGNGVKDTLKLPCTKGKKGRGVVNEKNKIVIGGEPGDDHGVIGTKPNTLVVLENGKCVERTYPPGGKPKEVVLSDKACEDAKKDMRQANKEAKEKKEQEKKQFEDIGKGLGVKLLNLNDPFKSMGLGLKI